MSFEAGIISLNQNGRVMTSHFSTALFTGEEGAHKTLYVSSGDLTLSDGFAASLGAALLVDDTLRFDLASSASLEIIADADDLFVLASALKQLNLPLAEFFEGSGIASVTLSESDPSKLAQLGLLGNSELLNVITEVNVSGGSGPLELPVGLYKSGFDVSGFGDITIVGSGEEIQKFLAASDVPASLSSKIVEYKVVSGDLYIEASRFFSASTDTTLFTASSNDEFNPADVIASGSVVDFDGTGIDFTRITAEGSYGFAFAQVRDTATNITAAHGDSTFSSGLIDNLEIIFEHKVESDSDTITTVTGLEDYIVFDPTAITDGASFELVNDFDIGLDTFSFALLTGYDNETDPFGVGTVSQDFTFIDNGQALGNLSALGAGDKPRVEIRISESDSTHIEFNGLAASYELDQGPEVSPDFTIILANDIAGDLNVFHFNGIPYIDEISIDDFLDETAAIPDAELMRFLRLEAVGDSAEQAFFFTLDLFYDPGSLGSSARTSMLVNTLNPDGEALYGQDGSDFLSGGSGNDIIFGDVLAGFGDDDIEGGAGNDFISGDGGDDIIDGGEGEDWIEGGIGADDIYGGAGNDTLIGNFESEIGEFSYSDKDYIQGDAGNDFILGKYDADVIDGGTGHDTIFGGSGEDAIWGDDGDDYIDGGDDGDDLNGDAGEDTIFGGDGWDNLDGGSGDDELYGEGGEDYIVGGTGNDFLSGGGGNDIDTDVLFGGEGNDTLFGGGGNDMLSGGEGIDLLTGGNGSDVFSFEANNTLGDMILDFNSAQDKLELGLPIFGSGAIHDNFYSSYTSAYSYLTVDDYTYITLTTVYHYNTHLHVLAQNFTEGGDPFSTKTTDWFTYQSTLPLFMNFTTEAGAANPVDLFRSNLIGLSGPRWERNFTEFPLTKMYNYVTKTTTITPEGETNYSALILAPSTLFGTSYQSSTLNGATNANAVGVYLAFGLVNGHLLMATIHNGGPLNDFAITAGEITGTRTIATFSGAQPNNINANWYIPEVLIV